MAKPRVFISSTYYDLKQIRYDLEEFCRQMGYEAVLFERGDVPYAKDAPLEDGCYDEISLCDILVAVVGGRFGAASQTQEPYSVTQAELRRALALGKQVYTFVEQSVLSEYRTYTKNRDNPSVKYSYVDDSRVYVFLDEIYALGSNNVVHEFGNVDDITDYLRDQWAGLFQRYLRDQGRVSEARIVDGLAASAEVLRQAVTYLTEERRNKDDAIREILFASHPAFSQLQQLLSIRHRVYFANWQELDSLVSTYGWRSRERDELASGDGERSYEWDRTLRRKGRDDVEEELHVGGDVFDRSGRLRVFTSADWNEAWITRRELPDGPPSPDDIPF